MLRKTTLIALAAVGVLACASQLWAEHDDAVAYPLDYRAWKHVKSALIGPQSPIYESYGGMHHIYANEKAMAGYRSGQFPDGSVIVFDLLETRESGGVTTEGPRRFIDVMAKDNKRYAASGGWGYEEFKGDGKTEPSLTAHAKDACYKCHTRQKDRDFVFSAFRK